MSKFNGCAYNYTGSKARHLKSLYEILPKEGKLSCLDLFCGAASLATQLPESWKITANDKESRLISLHKYFQVNSITSENLSLFVDTVVKNYCHSYIKSKEDKEGYGELVESYNKMTTNTDLKLYALICSSFSNQLRWNSSGEWNLPFGNRYFNPSLQKKLLRYLELLQEKDITFTNKDFRKFDFNEYDIVISDSPYLKTLACYQDKANGWNFKDTVQLLSKLDKYTEQGGKFILFEESYSKGKPNTLLLDWMTKYNVKQLGNNSDKSNYQRKGGKTQEVLVYNF